MASKPEQEPSIEEILASIRQIISDDDQPRDSALDLSQGPEEKFEIPVADQESGKKPASNFADVLELTNEIRDEDDEAEESFDEVVPEPAPPAPTPEPVFEPAKEIREEPMATVDSQSKDGSIFSDTAAEATSAAFSKLMGNIPVEREENKTLYPEGRITLEDLAKDLLRPMLREWINANVPAMVERLVEKELEKLARQARDD